MARETKDSDGRPKSKQRVLSHSSLEQFNKEQQKRGRRSGCCSLPRRTAETDGDTDSDARSSSRWRGPGPSIVLAALVCLFASSTGGVALAAVLLARQRAAAGPGPTSADQEREAREALRDPAFYLARDLILFASAMAFLYIVLHVRAARRRAYCCVAAAARGGSVSGRGSSGSEGDASARDSCSTESGGAVAAAAAAAVATTTTDQSSRDGSTTESGSGSYSMRTTMRCNSSEAAAMRRTRLPPHLRGNYLHASALLVARLAIVIWIAALIATAVMIARAGSVPFRYADGTKKGFVGAVPILNLLICMGAM